MPSSSNPELTFAMGIGALLAGGFMACRSLRLIIGATRTMGTVIDVKETTHYDNGRLRTRGEPTIEYVDDRGETQQFTTNDVSTRYRSKDVGKSVPVYYFPGGTRTAYAGRFTDLWSTPAVFFVIGGTFSYIGWQHMLS